MVFRRHIRLDGDGLNFPLYAGKSRIHGWGAITKRAHQKGDLIIEYSGELIRPSVADAREQQLYDRLVGAGTYIFRMNDNTCVDATRAGRQILHCPALP